MNQGPPPGYQGPPPGYQGPPPGYQSPPPPSPNPPAFGPPPGFPGNFGPPPPPTKSRLSPAAILAVFVGLLVVLSVVAGVIIFANQPPPPVPPCQPGEPCAPPPSLPPVSIASPTPAASLQPGQSSAPATPAPSGPPTTPGASGVPASPVPTPESNAPPVLSGTLFKDDELGYSFEYDPEVFTLTDSAKGSAVLTGVFFDAVIWVDVVPADTSPREQIADELTFIDRFLLGRVTDLDAYDALLGPSIGYVKGEGEVYSGTLISRDGTPIEPGAVAIVSSTDGRLTAAIVVIVGSPDLRHGGETQAHATRSAADDIVKTFNWNAQ